MGDTVWATDLAPVIEVSRVDPVTGNLLVRGQPFLMVRGDTVDYGTILGNETYKVSEWDVHLRELTNAGMNVIAGGWHDLSNTAIPGFLFDDNTFNRNQMQDLSHYQRFGQYWWGNAGGVDTGGGGCSPSPLDAPCVTAFMNGKKDRSNLILWQFSGELQVGSPLNVWTAVYALMRSVDPTRTLGDYILTSVPNIQNWFGANVLNIPLPEVVMNAGPWPLIRSTDAKNALSAHADLKNMIDMFDTAWNAGQRFVYTLALTPITELGNLTALLSFNLTSSTAITTAPGNFTVTPSAMSGTVLGAAWSIGVGTVLRVDAGGAQEYVTVTVINAGAGTFTALFKNNHTGTWPIFGYVPAYIPFAPRLQVRRAVFYAVARNCRAFAMLWGPSARGFPSALNPITLSGVDAADTFLTQATVWNRDGSPPPESFTLYNVGVDGAVTDSVLTPLLDNGRLPSIMDVFGYWNGVVADMVSLKAVILDGQRWTHLTTNPQDSGATPGIYAALKTVAGITYVIACNQDSAPATFGGETQNLERQVNGATITVGSGTTCIRLFEAGSPTFSGGVITDNFRPMETHVYRVT